MVRTTTGMVVKISILTRPYSEKARKEIVDEIARLLKSRGSRLSQYTPVVKVESGKYKRVVEM